jgi:hypothetical protein
MDMKQKQRAAIEFLLFEGRSSDEIAQRFHDMCGQDADCRASVFRWIQEVRGGNEELRNEGPPGRPCRHEVDIAIRSILQDEPSVSLQTIAETLAISPETVRSHPIWRGLDRQITTDLLIAMHGFASHSQSVKIRDKHHVLVLSPPTSPRLPRAIVFTIGESANK